MSNTCFPYSTIKEVYLIQLPFESVSLQKLTACLSDDEHKRASSYHFEAGQRTFTTGRAILRKLLAYHLNCSAASINFVYGTHGKPYLINQSGQKELHFSVTNTADLIAIAISSSRIGIDAERIMQLDYSELYDTTLSLKEKNHLRLTPEQDQECTFLRLWTRKEALLKAIGIGLTDELTSIEMIEEGMLWRTVADKKWASGQQSFYVRDIDIGDNFIATVVVETMEPPVVTIIPLETIISELPKSLFAINILNSLYFIK